MSLVTATNIYRPKELKHFSLLLSPFGSPKYSKHCTFSRARSPRPSEATSWRGWSWIELSGWSLPNNPHACYFSKTSREAGTSLHFKFGCVILWPFISTISLTAQPPLLRQMIQVSKRHNLTFASKKKNLREHFALKDAFTRAIQLLPDALGRMPPEGSDTYTRSPLQKETSKYTCQPVLQENIMKELEKQGATQNSHWWQREDDYLLLWISRTSTGFKNAESASSARLHNHCARLSLHAA